MLPVPSERDDLPQAHVTLAEFKRHVRQVSLIVVTFSMVILACVSVGIALDLHTLQRTRAREVADFDAYSAGMLSRLDSMLWKMDTQAEITGATNKVLADALVKMRAQVKLNSDTGAKTATATTTIAREAVKQTAATAQLVQQVADNPKPVVNVEVPKTQPPPVVVQPAPTPPVHAAPPPHKEPSAQPRRGAWRWMRRLWPPWGKNGERSE